MLNRHYVTPFRTAGTAPFHAGSVKVHLPSRPIHLLAHPTIFSAPETLGLPSLPTGKNPRRAVSENKAPSFGATRDREHTPLRLPALFRSMEL